MTVDTACEGKNPQFLSSYGISTRRRKDYIIPATSGWLDDRPMYPFGSYESALVKTKALKPSLPYDPDFAVQYSLSLILDSLWVAINAASQICDKVWISSQNQMAYAVKPSPPPPPCFSCRLQQLFGGIDN
jgi:hypothetical protein